MVGRYYAVIDFECTCWDSSDRAGNEHEIIEFPVVFLNVDTLQIDFEFHEYVRPTENACISDFCFSLTGISQAQVDDADPLEAVLERFSDFIRTNGINDLTVCTDGPWDFVKFLQPECKRKHLAYPSWATTWVDIRRLFMHTYRLEKWINVDEMLKYLKFEFVGRPHSGIDDARNITRILRSVHKQRGGRLLRAIRKIS